MKPKQILEQEAEITVSSTVLDKEKTKSKKIKIRPFVTEPIKVGIKLGTTISNQDIPNSGSDYGNAKVDIMIIAPAYIEEVRDIFKQVKELAYELIEKEIKTIKGEETENQEEILDDLPF